MGDARLSTFTLSTITSKVAVYAPAERADTLPIFLLCSFLLCGSDLVTAGRKKGKRRLLCGGEVRVRSWGEVGREGGVGV